MKTDSVEVEHVSVKSEETSSKTGDNHQGFKERLVSIGQAGSNNAMGSYGVNKEATLKSIVSMRKTQVEIFRKHMGLELSLSENMDSEAEMNSKEFSEKFQEEFKAKENDLKSITTMLDNLSQVMSSVNNDTKAELLPTEPGLPQPPTKNVLKSLQRTRAQNIRLDKQPSWRTKLRLNPSNQAEPKK